MSTAPPSSHTTPTTATDDSPPFRYTAALANQIEGKWQDAWDAARTFQSPNPGEPGFDGSRPKKFILDMFPYPSGAGLHVGHPLGYIATDIFARYLRMTGHNVLHAMGFDAFGLPAEQYAVQTNTHPRVTTEANIATMRRQLRRLGLGHDPRRGVSTTDEAFYKWTQWIFLQIYQSWYDPEAPARDGVGKGRARPIAELVLDYDHGRRKIPGDDRPWSQVPAEVRKRVIDSHRLAYLAEVPVNWCPMLGTVLANEEVTSEGRSERGDFPVYKRPLKQWMLRITSYAERLIADLGVVDWPESVKLLQRNWIGRSEGAYVDFACANRRIRVFTTRPDTLFGATFLVLAPDHPMVDELAGEKYTGSPSEPARVAVFDGAHELTERGAGPRAVIAAYRELVRRKRESAAEEGEGAEKTGVFIGAYAINPATQQRVPVFIADYVMMGYGTGAIMAVPAHDERDFAFADRFGLPVRCVVRPADNEPGVNAEAVLAGRECFSGAGVAMNSPAPGAPKSALDINGLALEQAKKRITVGLEAAGFGEAHTTYKLRDWLFSRQRYWGEPFPIVFDEQGHAHALPESMLPVVLPKMDNFQPEASTDPDAPPRPPLARAQEWANVELDLGDGRGPRRFTRETNTMPNWAGSCWYYLRYLDPENSAALVGKEAEAYWMQSLKSDNTMHRGGVDLYVGGVEHAVLHLLYARFWHKVLFDLGHVSTPEPFGRLFNQGYIQAFAYRDIRGMYVPAEEVAEREQEVHVDIDRLELSSGEGEPIQRATKFFWNDQPVFQEYGKMGKSLKNAVAPDEVCRQFGCDTLRLYEMSMGPLEASKPWNTRDIAGSYRFLQRAWRCIVDEQSGSLRVGDAEPTAALARAMHRTIDGVRKDMAALSFNTAVSKLIEFVNDLTKAMAEIGSCPRACATNLTLMLAPLAPHVAEELWSRLGNPPSVAFAGYPSADPSMLVESEVEYAVQVQGKVRARIMAPAAADAKSVEAIAMSDPGVVAFLEGKTVKKVIVVPGKLVNVVV